jgi:hypothetical protein
MRIGSLVKIGAVAALAAGLVPQVVNAQAARWTGTFTWDATAKGGQLVINTTPSGWATVSLTPAGAKQALMAEGDAAPPKGQPAGLRGTFTLGDDGQLSVDLPAFREPGCNCVLLGTLEGTVSGQSASGNIAVRNSQTGQWQFASWTATSGARGRGR